MVTLNTARWIDRKLGKPACFFLSLVGKLQNHRVPDKETVKEILVIKMFGMGTIVLSSPVFSNLRKNCPRARISFLTLKGNRGLYEDSDIVDEVFYFDISSVWRAFLSFFRVVRWFWTRKFDIVIDLEIASRFTAILAFLNLKSMRMGYAPAGSGKNIFDLTIPYNESAHITRIMLRSIDALGFRVFDEKLVPLPVTEEDRRKVEDFIKREELDWFVAINPNTSTLALERLWPLEYYGELGRLLLQQYPDTKIVIIGGPGDEERTTTLGRLIGDTNGRVVDTAGSFSVRQTFELLRHASVFVSNDSGPLHLGVIADIPTIGLFGPETPVLYGPRGDKHRSISSNEICSPCISVYEDKVVNCRIGVICMKNIRVETVLDAVQELLNSPK